MSNFDILDEGFIYESLETDIVLAQSKKIAKRVLVLSLLFGVFSAFCVLVTMEAYGKSLGNRESNYFLIAAIFTQLGTLFLTIRLFLYQRNIYKKQNWIQIFESKYKVWRALAIVFFLVLTSIVVLVSEVNGIFK